VIWILLYSEKLKENTADQIINVIYKDEKQYKWSYLRFPNPMT